MSTSSEKAKKLIDLFSRIKPFEKVLNEVVQDKNNPELSQPKIPDPISWTRASQEKRVAFITAQTQASLDMLAGTKPLPEPDIMQGNIENYIGMTQVPTGVIGPLMIHGASAQGDFYVPLATSEGALIASYNRGARATRLSGGIVSVCLTEGVQRAPLFKFKTLSEVGAR